MKPILTGGKKPFIEAHRGAPTFCPENTIIAFEKAYELQADLIEIDVQFTKDKEIIVFHDYHLDDKTNGVGLVKDHTLKELKELDAGSWFSDEFAGEKLVTLEEVLKWAKGKIWLSIELKHVESYGESLVKKAVEKIHAHHMEKQVQMISFNHEMLAMVRKYCSEIMTSAICPCKVYDPVNYLEKIGAQAYNGPAYFLTKEEVKMIQDAGRYVNAGMVDDPELWKKYEAWGVDLMCTNVPEIMISTRGNNG